MKNLRTYGNPPFSIVVVHGGPGAPGEMKPVAEELSKNFGVIEPLQTKDSINGQIEELKKVIEENTISPVYLIGWSWGAWLSCLLTSQYPNLVKKLILVSSGPFEASYAKQIMPTRLQRLTPQEQLEVETIIKSLKNNEKDNPLFKKFGKLMDKADSYNPIHQDENKESDFQPDIYEKVWNEASNLRSTGKLLEKVSKITCPVVAIHGDYDPHPTEGVQKPLSNTLKDFKFYLLKECGHHPWLEQNAKDKFYEVLSQELRDVS